MSTPRRRRSGGRKSGKGRGTIPPDIHLSEVVAGSPPYAKDEIRHLIKVSRKTRESFSTAGSIDCQGGPGSEYMW